MREQIIKVKEECDAYRKAMVAWTDQMIAWANQLDAAKEKEGALQARIDALMLEYCPNEMTQEQLLNWAKHQAPVP